MVELGFGVEVGSGESIDWIVGSRDSGVIGLAKGIVQDGIGGGPGGAMALWSGCV